MRVVVCLVASAAVALFAMAPAAAQPLRIYHIDVNSRLHWNSTAFELAKGREYRFTASGTWYDASIAATATGFSDPRLDWLGWMRRMPRARWLSVVGAIDMRRETRFDIGRLIEDGSTYTATASGTLYCYANDVWFMYWNNTGSIDLEIVEMSGESQLPSGSRI
jgi:hypothetical protein